MVQNAYSQALSTTAALFVPADPGRSGLCIGNADATINIFVSSDPRLTSTGTTGFLIPAKTVLYIDLPGFDPHLQYYAVAASGTPTASVLMGFTKV